MKLTWGGAVKEVVVGADGKWSATFPSSQVPADGNTTLTATVTDPAGNASSPTKRAIEIDTHAGAAPVISSAPAVVNGAAKAAGVTVSGTAEAGSTVKLTWGDTAKEVVADMDGKWSATFTSDQVPADGNTTLTATVTDPAGNASSPTKQAIEIDTHAGAAPVISSVPAVVNSAAKAAGVTVSGTAEAGNTVKLTWGGAVKEVVAGADGKWSATFTSDQVPADGNTTLSATVTDAVGNTSSPNTSSIAVDTSVAAPVIGVVAGDDIVDTGESAAGVVVNGTAEAGSTVKLTWGDVVKDVVADKDGKWTATFTSDQMPANGTTTLHAKVTDAAGNVSESSRPVTVDGTLALSSELQGVANLDVRSDLVLKSSAPVTLADGTWTIKLVNDSNDTTKLGFKSESSDNSQTLTFTVVNGVVTSSTGGELKLSANGRSITFNPKYDLDLSNKYHLEVPAGMFKGGDGSTNDALSPSFSTVTPGGYSPTGEKLGGAESKMFDSTGALVAGP
ncbi:Ig-like protein group 3, partial [Pseudomonas sp. LAMO17WK12:I9]